MFGIVTKKELSKESVKIKESFDKRDINFKELKDKVNSIDTQLAKIEGMISVILSKSQVSVSNSLTKSQSVSSNIETRLISKIKRSKKDIILNEIESLSSSMPTIEIYDIVVLQKGLCSKASFYRYVKSLKSQKPIETSNKLRLKN